MTQPRGELTTYRARGGHATDWANPTRSLWKGHLTVNLNINVLISTPDEKPPLLKGHFSDIKGVATQEGFHCIQFRQESF